jgi:hypothetical protein
MQPLMETLYRMKKRMTYAALSKKTGVPEHTLFRWLTGRSQISKAWQELIARNLSE